MRDRQQPGRAILALAGGSVQADSMQTRCNVRVAALSGGKRARDIAAGRRESLARDGRAQEKKPRAGQVTRSLLGSSVIGRKRCREKAPRFVMLLLACGTGPLATSLFAADPTLGEPFARGMKAKRASEESLRLPFRWFRRTLWDANRRS